MTNAANPKKKDLASYLDPVLLQFQSLGQLLSQIYTRVGIDLKYAFQDLNLGRNIKLP